MFDICSGTVARMRAIARGQRYRQAACASRLRVAGYCSRRLRQLVGSCGPSQGSTPLPFLYRLKGHGSRRKRRRQSWVRHKLSSGHNYAATTAVQAPLPRSSPSTGLGEPKPLFPNVKPNIYITMQPTCNPFRVKRWV